MKKLISIISAFAMTAAMAVPFSAFASDPETPESEEKPSEVVINQDSDPNTGATYVKYDVDAAYMVTIPAKVTLSDKNETADIKFSDVLLAKGQKISVELSDAANKDYDTESEFNVAQSQEVYAKYTVTSKDGKTTYKLKDEVAAFAYDGTATEATETLTFTKPTGAKYAGTYTDTLTFTISTVDAPATVNVKIGNDTFTVPAGMTWYDIIFESDVNIGAGVGVDDGNQIMRNSDDIAFLHEGIEFGDATVNATTQPDPNKTYYWKAF